MYDEGKGNKNNKITVSVINYWCDKKLSMKESVTNYKIKITDGLFWFVKYLFITWALPHKNIKINKFFDIFTRYGVVCLISRW